MSSSRRGPIAFLVRAAIFLVLFAGVAEVWLRTVVPAAEHPAYYQESEWNVLQYDTRSPSTGLNTVGRLALGRGQWRVNDDGWISPIEYLSPAERDGQLVALIGDSFIAGYQTDVDEHVDPFLSQTLGAGVDVYAFGQGGWYLEQYRAVSRYVTATYAPDLLIVFIGKKDVMNSIRDNGVVSPYMWQISVSGHGFNEVPPTRTYSFPRVAQWARLSAIVRYLRYNAKVALPGMQNVAIAGEVDPEDAAGGGAAGDDAVPSTEAADWRGLLPAAQYVVDGLCAENPGTPVLFAVRGSPDEWYLSLDELADTPAVADALAVQAACAEHPDCHYLDLRVAFCQDWTVNHHRFVTTDGVHWNAYANQLVAQTLAEFLQEENLLSN
ncbi:MAG: SGNH/GDSL hydrolase family protein [Thermoleophilia bacterium]|nr:SGNH/GDSL hydrolase family protein [Thermoleophilia bacterium]